MSESRREVSGGEGRLSLRSDWVVFSWQQETLQQVWTPAATQALQTAGQILYVIVLPGILDIWLFLSALAYCRTLGFSLKDDKIYQHFTIK